MQTPLSALYVTLNKFLDTHSLVQAHAVYQCSLCTHAAVQTSWCDCLVFPAWLPLCNSSCVLQAEAISNSSSMFDITWSCVLQVQFMTYAFGGSENYHGKDMWRAHEKLIREQGLRDHHFDVIVKHLVAALQQAGVPEVRVPYLQLYLIQHKYCPPLAAHTESNQYISCSSLYS